MKRIALALIVCLWASLAFGQPAQQFQQGLIGSGNSGYPPGSTAATVSGTGTTAGASASLPNVASQFTYLCGFSVSPGTASAAITISVKVTNVGIGRSCSVWVPATAAGRTGVRFS